MWWDYNAIFMNSNYNPALFLQTNGLVVEGSPITGPFGGHYIYRSKFGL